MIYTGLSMIVCSVLALSGVLYQIHANLIKAFHGRVWDNPLSAPVNEVERRHLRVSCEECSFIALTRVSYTIPVDTTQVHVKD